MTPSRTADPRMVLVVLAVVAGAGTLAVLLNRAPDGREPEQNPIEKPAPPPPPFADSPFLNARSDVEFIGTAACAKCHESNHRSYKLTPHSRALSIVDPATEPADGAFRHKATGRDYRVFRRDGRLYHEESLSTESGREIGRISVPVRYLVGSGNFSRTYLVESDGFLTESPITWYSSTKSWGMSPGYDLPQHAGFERAVSKDCLVCHSGRVESDARTFHELAIGCENCHGRGALHRDRYARTSPPPEGEDWTIVNPRKLTRALQEDICAACHQSGSATVAVRGRDKTDIYPGRPLNDFQIHYRTEGGNDRMTVVGHVEQLHSSACFQKSATLTCTTCHDPHRREAVQNSSEFYRQKCLTCHTPQSCSSEPAARTKTTPADNCISCHMPHGDTEIPHIAFTHHRIGRHGKPAPAAADRIPRLVPVGDVSRLSAEDRDRNLGFAYLEAMRNPANVPYATAYLDEARRLLESAHGAGLQDGQTLAALAVAHSYGNRRESIVFARRALRTGDLPPLMRTTMLMLVSYFDPSPDREEMLIELTKLRSNGGDHRMLGMLYLQQNEPRRALSSFEKAFALRPFRPLVHSGLAETYRRLGDKARAQAHSEFERWLTEHQQD